MVFYVFRASPERVRPLFKQSLVGFHVAPHPNQDRSHRSGFSSVAKINLNGHREVFSTWAQSWRSSLDATLTSTPPEPASGSE